MGVLVLLVSVSILPLCSAFQVKYFGDVDKEEINNLLDSIPDFYFQNLKYLYFYECVPSYLYGYYINGKIWINMCRFERHNVTLEQALSHELGRSYWNIQMSYRDRMEWCDFVSISGYVSCATNFADAFYVYPISNEK